MVLRPSEDGRSDPKFHSSRVFSDLVSASGSHIPFSLGVLLFGVARVFEVVGSSVETLPGNRSNPLVGFA